MKRRLTRAYDHMTMPDACAHCIEQRLQQELELRKSGQYTKAITPTHTHHGGWTAAVAAVFLMLVISVGGTVLALNAPPLLRTAPPETEHTVLPEDRYTVATDIPAVQVEAFAKIVQHNVIMENWDALADKVSFPLTIQDQRISDKKTFTEWMEIFQLNPSFRDAVAADSCTDMFCNWQGICMGNGLIWINEIDGELKITAINVETQEEPEDKSQGKQVPEVFAEIISGDRIKMVGVLNKLTIDEYCTNWQGDVKLDAFAVVDMDGDGVCELVYSLTDEQGAQCGNMVLRQEGNEICGYPFWSGELLDLKKDGTFFRGDRDHRLVFNDKTSCYTEEVTEQSEKPLAQWHTYPCQRPELLLQSYEYVTGTGQSLFPGNHYYHFEGLVLGSMGNDWNLQKEQMVRYGMICVEDEGTVSVFDPDAPGTALYGVLTNENGVVTFSELGFYICTEEKEYVAEARRLPDEEPEYMVDAHLPALGSMGRRVYSPEELVSYFGFTQYSQEVIAQRQAAKAVVEQFTAAWLARDEKAMKRYLADDFREDTRRNGAEYSPAGTPERMTIRDLPQRVMNAGEECYVTAEFRDAEQNSWFSVCLDMVKQKEGWKVTSCYFGS